MEKVLIYFWPQIIVRSPKKSVLVVKVSHVKCPALIDNGAGNSYAPASFINRLNKKPNCQEVKKHTLMNWVAKKTKSYKTKVRHITQDFKIHIELKKMENKFLLLLPNLI